MTSNAQPQPPMRFGLGTWGDIAWLIAISSTLLLTLLPFSSYIVSVPFIRDEWAMSNTEAAVVFSAYLVGSALSSVFLLPITDRVPARWVLLASVVVMAASNALFPLLAQDIWSASLLRCATGAGHIGRIYTGRPPRLPALCGNKARNRRRRVCQHWVHWHHRLLRGYGMAPRPDRFMAVCLPCGRACGADRRGDSYCRAAGKTGIPPKRPPFPRPPRRHPECPAG